MLHQNSTPRYFHIRILALFALSLAGGCTHFGATASQKRAAHRALTDSEQRVVYFKVEETGENDSRNGRSRTATFSGLVLTPEGHLLAPYTIRPESETRIEAWIDQERFLARPLKVDDGMGMTIVKVEPTTPLVPMDLTNVEELEAGDTAFSVVSTDEESEFERYVFKAFCQGIIEGRYRQFSLSPLPGTARGAPLYNSRGDLVGIVNQSNAWALSDLVADLDELLQRATGKAGDGESGSEDVWFGAILAPINPDYAKANGLPRSGLWLVHVFENGSAGQAGFQTGDLVVSLEDEPLRLSGRRAYQYFMQTLRPREGKPFTVTVIRDGKRIRRKGKILERPEPDTLRADDLGVSISGINASMVVRFNLFESNGVMVTDVKPGSPAATGRSFGSTLLRPRDVILSIGGHPTPTVDAFGKALEQIRSEKPEALLVEFKRGPVSGYEALNLRIGDQENGGTP